MTYISLVRYLCLNKTDHRVSPAYQKQKEKEIRIEKCMTYDFLKIILVIIPSNINAVATRIFYHTEHKFETILMIWILLIIIFNINKEKLICAFNLFFFNTFQSCLILLLFFFYFNGSIWKHLF